jgi:hypothetical protein
MSAETGKRNPDRMNMIGVVVVGICGAVLVYVSIALLQAFYMNDTSDVETNAAYGGQEVGARSLRDAQLLNVNGTPQGGPHHGDTFSIPIERAMELVVADAQKDPSALVPSQGKSIVPTVQPIYGRPKQLNQPTPAAGSGAGGGSGGGSGAGSGSGAAPPAAAGGGSGSAAAPAAGSGGHAP